MPCFDKLSLYYETQKFIPKSYTWYHPRLRKNKEVFDFIHIYGDHRLEGSKKDLDLCLRLSHKNTIILFDDKNLPQLNYLFSRYLRKGISEKFKFK